ncbi:hypothetical protein EMIT0P201_10921 [Pseudomonas chlororaphis]
MIHGTVTQTLTLPSRIIGCAGDERLWQGTANGRQYARRQSQCGQGAGATGQRMGRVHRAPRGA